LYKSHGKNWNFLQKSWTGSIVGTIFSILCCIGVCGSICYCCYKKGQGSSNNAAPVATFKSTTEAPTTQAGYSTVPNVPPPGQPVPGYQAAPAYYPPVQPQYVAPVQPQYVAPVQPQYAPQPGLAHPLTYPQPGYQPAPYGTQPPVQPAYVQQPPMDEKPTNSDFSCPPPPAATETHQPYQPKPTQPSA